MLGSTASRVVPVSKSPPIFTIYRDKTHSLDTLQSLVPVFHQLVTFKNSQIFFFLYSSIRSSISLKFSIYSHKVSRTITDGLFIHLFVVLNSFCDYVTVDGHDLKSRGGMPSFITSHFPSPTITHSQSPVTAHIGQRSQRHAQALSVLARSQNARCRVSVVVQGKGQYEDEKQTLTSSGRRPVRRNCQIMNCHHPRPPPHSGSGLHYVSFPTPTQPEDCRCDRCPSDQPAGSSLQPVA